MSLLSWGGKLAYTWYYKLLNRSKKVKIKSGARCYRKCTFGGYNVINEGAIVSNSSLGFASYIGRNTNATGVKIGKYCSVGANMHVYAYTHPTSTFVSTAPCFYSMGKQCGMTYVSEQKFDECKTLKEEGYHVVIGNDVWIGNDVTIMGGLRIGNGAVLGSGCIVTKDVPDYAIVAGVPAKVIKYRFLPDQIEALQKICWWDQDQEWIRKHADCFSNIRDFLGNAENLIEKNV